jgi:uncharacterized protein YbjT (DUF2867 family)
MSGSSGTAPSLHSGTRARLAPPMILVTGATGKVGAELVRRLSQARAGFRALVRSAGKAEAIREAGGEAVVGDLADAAAVKTALRGVEKLFLLTNSVAEQPQVEARLVDAAKTAGVLRVVKLSSTGADAPSAPLFLKLHGDAERAIEASGLPWTFLRPNFFMQNYLDYADAIRTNGVLASPAGEGKHADIDARDIGEVAARVLREDGHEGRIYELTGAEAYSYGDVARRIATITGRDVRFVDQSPEDGYRALVKAGESEWSANAWVEMLDWFQRDENATRVAGVSRDVEKILGRPPRSLDAFLRENVRAFGG